MGFLASLAGGASPGKALGMSGAGLGVTAALGADMPPWLKMIMGQAGQPGMGAAMGAGAAGSRMSEGVMGFDPVAMGNPNKGPSGLQRGIGALGQGLQHMGQNQNEPMQELPQPNDPLAILRSLGLDIGANRLGRLGQP